MVQQNSLSRNIFILFNYSFLILLSLLCILPIVHVLAISLSSSSATAADMVKFWPIDFTLSSYKFVIHKSEFITSLVVTVKRVVLGVSTNMLMTILIAYPLSKEVQAFKGRTLYAWFFVFTILFNGGLIPWYLTIKTTGLLDTIWALVLPGAVPVFNIVLVLNFFRGLPKELGESAFVDGAGHWTVLWKIIVPLSAPVLATVALFSTVGHWNAWFDGMLLMNSPDNYPLQSYLRTVIIQPDVSLMSVTDMKTLAEISDRTVRAAQIFLASLPILIVYPFLQRFFMKGIVLGSVKE